MPRVLCGLPALEAASATTAGGLGNEFIAALDPSLVDAGCAVEVYRLQRLRPDEAVSSGEVVLCQLPTWGFDLAELDSLTGEVEDLRAEREELLQRLERSLEALATLSAAGASTSALVERPETLGEARQRPKPPVAPTGAQAALTSSSSRSDREVKKENAELRQQLAESEERCKNTRSCLIQLRSEFMQCVKLLSAEGGFGSSDGVLAAAYVDALAREGKNGETHPALFDTFQSRPSARTEAERAHYVSPGAGGQRHQGRSPRVGMASPGAGVSPRLVSRPKSSQQRGGPPPIAVPGATAGPYGRR